MLKGFRDFITRGNVIDLAVGIVIGAAFGAVVTQFTKSFLEPLIKVLTGGYDVGGIFKVRGVEFNYGAFINALIAFFLTAVAVYFFVVVPMGKLIKKKAEADAEEVVLLREIRDRLPRNPD